jgi:hypothetical protein
VAAFDDHHRRRGIGNHRHREHQPQMLRADHQAHDRQAQRECPACADEDTHPTRAEIIEFGCSHAAGSPQPAGGAASVMIAWPAVADASRALPITT